MDIQLCLTVAWELYKKNFALLFVVTLLATILGSLTCFILMGPMYAGVTLIALRLLRQSEPVPEIGNVFDGFSFFLPTFLFILVSFIVGALLGFIPFAGLLLIFICPLLMFVFCFICDQKMDFWPAIVASYELAKVRYWPCLGLYLLSAVIGMAGALLCGIGMLFTAPFSMLLPVVAYYQLMQDAPDAVVVEEEVVVEAIPPPVV